MDFVRNLSAFLAKGKTAFSAMDFLTDYYSNCSTDEEWLQYYVFRAILSAESSFFDDIHRLSSSSPEAVATGLINLSNKLESKNIPIFLSAYYISNTAKALGLAVTPLSYVPLSSDYVKACRRTYGQTFGLGCKGIPDASDGVFTMNGSELKKYGGNAPVVFIPDGVDSIGTNAFQKVSGVQVVVLAPSVKSVGDGAFSKMPDLSVVVFNDQALTIGPNAFRSDPQLSTLMRTSHITVIGQNAFNGDTSLRIDLGAFSSLTTIGTQAFASADAFTGHLQFPTTLKRLEREAFKENRGITSVSIPGTIEGIGENVFAGDDCIEDLELDMRRGGDVSPSMLGLSMVKRVKVRGKRIPDNAFASLYELERVEIDPELEEIGASAFENCKNLVEIVSTSPAKIKKLGTRAFDSCGSLNHLDIEIVGDTIPEECFRFCSELTEIPKCMNVRFIHDWAFSGMMGITAAVFPKAIDTLSTGAFAYCDNLASVRFLGGIKSLSPSCFAECYNLKTVQGRVASSLIPDECFVYCQSLEKIPVLTPGMTYDIGAGAFGAANLLFSDFTFKIHSLGMNAFKNAMLPPVISMDISSCASLTVGSLAPFKHFAKFVCGDKTEIVGAGSMKTTAKDLWLLFTGAWEDLVIDELSVVGSVILPSPAPKIGRMGYFISDGIVADHQFEKNSELKELSLNGTITVLGAYSFAGCENLTKIHMTLGSPFVLKEHALEKCYSLEDLKVLAEKASSIGSCALASTCIEELDLSSCASLETEALYHIDGLKKVTLSLSSLDGKSLYEVLSSPTLEELVLKGKGTLDANAFNETKAIEKLCIDGEIAFGDGCLNVLSGSLKEIVLGKDALPFDGSFLKQTKAKLTIDPANPKIAEKDGNYYSKDFATLFAVAPSFTGDPFLKETVNVGKYAFAASAMTSLTLPVSVRQIETNAFSSSSLEAIVVPMHASVAKEAFYDAPKLSKLTLECPIEGLTLPLFETGRPSLELEIKRGSSPFVVASFFASPSDPLLKKVSFAHCYLGDSCFKGLSKDMIDIGEGVIYGKGCFRSSPFREVTLTKESHYEEGCFAHCGKFESVVVEDGFNEPIAPFFRPFPVVGQCIKTLTIRGKSVPKGLCEDLERVELIDVPEGCLIIGNLAFAKVKASRLVLPATINSFSADALDGCEIDSIEISKSNPKFKSTGDGYLLFDDLLFLCTKERMTSFTPTMDMKGLLPNALARCHDLEEIVIPSPTFVLPKGCFCRLPKLKKLSLPSLNRPLRIDAPDSVASLEEVKVRNEDLPDYALEGFVALKRVIAPCLKTIGAHCFEGCSNLENVEGIENVAEIKDKAFASSGILSFSASSSLVFGETILAGCSRLAKMEIHLPLTKEMTLGGFFEQASSDSSVSQKGKDYLIPASLKEVVFYGETVPESFFENFSGTVSLQNDVNEVGARGLMGASINASKDHLLGITKAGEYAFANTDLDEMSFSNLAELSEGLFLGSSLRRVELTSELPSLPIKVFSGCGNLEAVDLRISTNVLPESFFEGCKVLSSAPFLSGVTEFGPRCLAGANLALLPKQEQWAKLGDEAFKDGIAHDLELDLTNTFTFGVRCFDGLSGLKSLKVWRLDPAILALFGGGSLALDTLSLLDESALDPLPGNIQPKHINIPSYSGAIPPSFCENKAELVSVKIDGSVTELGDRCFANCPELSSLEFLGDEIVLGKSCFKEDKKLSLGPILSRVAKLAEGSLEGCYVPSSLDLTKLTFLEKGALQGVHAEGSVELRLPFLGSNILDSTPFTLEELAPGLTVTSLHIEGGMLSKGAFEKSKLTKISFGSGIKMIPERCFFECENLESVHFEEVRRVGESAFEGCPKLTEVVGHFDLTRIPDRCFRKASGVASLDLDFAKVTSIGNLAFSEWDNAPESLDMPELHSVGIGAFSAVSSLGSISMPQVETIAENAFIHCSTLSSLTFGEKTRTIGKGAFAECPFDEKLALPVIESIGEEAFARCKNLTSVKLGDSLTSLGIKAFAGCFAIRSIQMPTYPHHVNENDPFEKRAFENLNSIVLTACPSLPDSAFEGCSKLKEARLYGPYRAIPKRAFFNCKKLSAIELMDDLDAIGESAFENCIGMKELEGAYRVGELQKRCFANCDGLDHVFFDGVHALGVEAFYDCNKMQEAFLQGDYTIIPDRCFHWCNKLHVVTLSTSVESIGVYAFRDCHYLPLFCIEKSVTAVGDRAFDGCDAPGFFLEVEDKAQRDALSSKAKYWNARHVGVIVVRRHKVKLRKRK